MAVKQINPSNVQRKNQYVGPTTDTAAFIAGPVDCTEGSTYMEEDGSKRVYMYNGTTWFQL